MNMAPEQDLSNFAAFDLDDLLAEIGSQNKTQKEEDHDQQKFIQVTIGVRAGSSCSN